MVFCIIIIIQKMFPPEKYRVDRYERCVMYHETHKKLVLLLNDNIFIIIMCKAAY